MILIQTLNVLVPSTLQGWTYGIRVRQGEELRVRARTPVKVTSTEYGYPEGFYGGDPTNANHPYSPPDLAGPPGTPSLWLSDTQTGGLVISATLYGSGAPSTSGGLTSADCPARDATYTYSDLATFAGVIDGSPVDFYAALNDELGQYADNSGSFLVTLTLYAPTGASNVSLPYSLVRAQRAELSIADPETSVDATTIPLVGQFNPDPKFTAENIHIMGSFGDQGQALEEEWGDFDMSLMWDFIDAVWWEVGAFAVPGVGSFDGDGTTLAVTGQALPVGISQYVIRPERRKVNVTQIFGLDYGAEHSDPAKTVVLSCTRAEVDGITRTLKRDGGPGSVSCKVTGFMRKPSNITIGSMAFKGNNFVWTITMVGGPTGGHVNVATDRGTFQIGATDTALTAQSAVDAVFGVSNTVVGRSGSGTALAPYVYTITGAVDLAGINVPLPTLTDVSLAGGTSPHSSFVETTKGGPVIANPIVEVRAPETTLWLAPTRGGCFTVDGGGKPNGYAIDNYEVTSTMTGLRGKDFVQNKAYDSYKDSVEKGTDDGRTETYTLKMPVKEEFLTLWSFLREGTAVYLGIQSLSNKEIIPSSGVYFERREIVKATITKVAPFSKNNAGVWQADVSLKIEDDPDYGGLGQIITYITKTHPEAYHVA